MGDADKARAVLDSRAYTVAGYIAGGLNKPTKLIFKSYAQRVIDAAEITLEQDILGTPRQDDRVRQLEDQLAQQAQLLEEQSARLAGQSAELEEQRAADDAIQAEIERARAEQDQLKADFEAFKRQAETPARLAPFPPPPGTEEGDGDGDTDANAPMRGPTAGAFMLGIGSMAVPVGHHGRVVHQDVVVAQLDDEAPIRYEDYDARVLGAMNKVIQRIRGLVRSSLNRVERPRDILDADNSDVGTMFLDLVVIELSLSENLAPTRPSLQITYDRNMELKRHAMNALSNFEFRRGDRGKPVITRAVRGGGPVAPMVQFQF